VLLILTACGDLTLDTARDDTDTAVGAARCATGEARSDATVTLFGFVYEVGLDVTPLAGVAATPCGADTPVGTSDSEGTWQLELPDDTWTMVELSSRDLLPVRGVLDARHEGSSGHPYRTGLAGPEAIDELLATLGVSLDPELAIVDVCISDDVDSYDLADATVDLDTPYELAFVRDEDGTFVEGRTTNGLYDVVFVNVQPGPVTLTVDHPTRGTCRVPPPLLAEASEVLNLNGYCQ